MLETEGRVNSRNTVARAFTGQALTFCTRKTEYRARLRPHGSDNLRGSRRKIDQGYEQPSRGRAHSYYLMAVPENIRQQGPSQCW